MRGILLHGILIASGAALGLAYAPTDLWPLAWLALVPPLWFATADRPRLLLTGGFCFGFTWGAVLVGWMVHIFPPLLAVQLWFLIGVICALAIGLVGYVRRVWGLGAAVALAPLLWVGIEFYRSEVWPLKFPWLALPYSQHTDLPFLQFASVVGVYGLSFIMVTFAALVVCALRRRSWVPAAGAVGLVAVLHLAGWLQMQAPTSASNPVTIAGAQLEAPTFTDLRRALEQLDRDHPDAQLVVLPEYCLNLTVPSQALRIVQQFAPRRWIIVGAKVPAGDGDFTSAAIALAPGGEVVFQQDKSVPVPLMADGLPAARRRPLETPFGKIGVAICFDLGFTFVSDDLVRQGAELLIYPTMDLASWGDRQRCQHAAVTPLRAIENRRWVLRVASSGISCAVDPYGRVVERQEIDARGGLIAARLERRSDQTLYARAGWVIPWICFWATALVILGVVVTDVRTKLRAALGRTVPADPKVPEFIAALAEPPATGPAHPQETSCLPR